MYIFKKIIVGILKLESRLIIAKYKPFIVAVTGSVGKTSTKDAIYSVLKDSSRYVRKSEKSLNSDIGLPLTVIGVPNAWHSLSGWLSNMSAGLRQIVKRADYPDCLILEIGADHPGDIKNVAKWLHPDIAVITKVSHTPVHVEFFKSPGELFEEKASLAFSVKTGGTVVLFADDERVMSIAERLKSRNVSIRSYGTSERADVRGTGFSLTYNKAVSGISFKISSGEASAAVSIGGVIGETYQYPFLAAAAVGMAREIPLAKITTELSAFDAPRGRMRIIAGINGSTLIDDTYNSSPDATMAALASLRSIDVTGSRVAVLGDMMELGKYAADEHRNVGRESAKVVARLITVGPRSRMTADEAVKAGLPAGSVRSFDSASEAAGSVKADIMPGDVILIKGSQSMRMERAVKALMFEPDKAADLLVRQEKEWLDKK